VTAEQVLFWVMSVLAIGSGIAMITMRNLVHAALMLVLNLLAVAGLFLTLQTTFLFAIQIIVYGGAIMVLFLFVIMMLGVRRDDLLVARDRLVRLGAWAVGGLFVVAVAFVFVGPYTGVASICGAEVEGARDAVRCIGLDQIYEDRDGSVVFAARELFTRYVFAFEFVALLLVVATIAALVIGRRSDHPDVEPGVLPEDRLPPASDLGSPVTPAAAPHGHGGGPPPGGDGTPGGRPADEGRG
jgi:NADH-quinone oxidoreductase subunit J